MKKLLLASTFALLTSMSYQASATTDTGVKDDSVIFMLTNSKLFYSSEEMSAYAEKNDGKFPKNFIMCVWDAYRIPTASNSGNIELLEQDLTTMGNPNNPVCPLPTSTYPS